MFYTYLLASKRYGTLYCGHTDDIAERVYKHKEKIFKGFTAKYGVHTLVRYEPHDSREGAFRRERPDQEVEAGVENRSNRGK